MSPNTCNFAYTGRPHIYIVIKTGAYDLFAGGADSGVDGMSAKLTCVGVVTTTRFQIVYNNIQSQHAW